jgi:hypothetical protein
MAQPTAPAKPKTAPANTPIGSAPTATEPAVATPAQPGPSAKVGGKNGTGVVNGAPEAKQDGKGSTTTPATGSQSAMEEAAKPGANHKLLEWFAGEWQVTVKDLTPGAESTDEGVMTAKMVYGGRFLQSEFDGRFHGKFFRGGGMMGYSNTTRKFESTWADGRDTAISFMTGSMSADNKVLTMTSEVADPANGKKITMKEVNKITGKDTYTGEIFMGETKVMELSYVRGKSAEKKDASAEKPKAK